MRDASARGQAFVIALLIAVVNCGAWKNAIAIVLVGAHRAYAHIGRAKRHAAINGLSKKSVGHKAGACRVVARVVKGEIDIARDRIDGKPVIEAVHELGEELIGYRMGSGPGESAIIGKGTQDVGDAGGSEIHPGAVETPAVSAGRAIGVTRRVNERPTKQLRWNADIKSGCLLRNSALRIPRDTAVERAIESDQIIFVIVPGYIDFAVGAHKRHSANTLARAGGVVNASETKSSSGIRRASEVNATVSRVPPTGGIPSRVNTVAEGARRIGVGRNHRLVIEVVRATLKPKQGELRIAHAAVGGTRHRHLRAIDAIASAKIHDNEAIKQISARVEDERGVRTKTSVVGALERRRKRQVHGTQ